jgi:hypothetical protein
LPGLSVLDFRARIQGDAPAWYLDISRVVDGATPSIGNNSGTVTASWQRIQMVATDHAGTDPLMLSIGLDSADTSECVLVTAVELEYVPPP